MHSRNRENMSLESSESSTFINNSIPDTTTKCPRKQSTESIVRSRREVTALDGLMFESAETRSSLDDASPTDAIEQAKLSGTDFISSNIQMDRMGPFSAGFTSHTSSDKREAALEIATNIYKTVTNTDSENNDASPKTTSTPLSSSSSTSSSSSSPSMSPGTPPESPAGDQPISPQLYSPDDGMMHVSPPQNKLSPPSLVHSSSLSAKRQSMFLPDHITISQDGPVIQSPSLQLSGSSDDQEDMKEVQIETTNPSHLFWVPFHLHPEIAPNEYNKWLSKHGVNSQNADGVMSPRKKSVTRRKSVLSAQYNPEDDHEDHPRKPAKIIEEKDSSDFLSGVFSAPLEQMGTPPLKTKASLRRSVSLSVSSPTREHFSVDEVEEDLMAAKRPGGLERGGLSLLRRSARTKIRRNSTASNDARTDVSRLRYNVDPDGEYTPVSLVDPGPQPRPSVALPSTVTTTATATAISATATATNINVSSEDSQKTQRNGETQPVKRFVSTLRDSSKPTITTYVEPHLLEQQRRDNEETNRNEGSISSFKVGVPGQLENSASTRILSETSDHQRIETTENFTISYPIPPPVKLTQNLLQQSTSQQPPSGKAPLSPQLPQLSIKQKQVGHTGTLVHGKKPSTWSWLWGKEKGDKSIENTSSGAGVSLPLSAKSNNTPSSQVSSTDINTQAFTSNEVAVKKQSTLSMLFSRNGKSTSSKAQITTVENTQMISTNGQSRQSIISERPKYSNYNRLPIHIERAIYRLSHVKLANPRRPLHEQVLISNMMFWYLGVIQQQQLLQQQQEQQQQQMLLQQAQRQIENNKGFESKEDGKEKSKSKPKKRKSQKKKSQQQKQQQHHHSNPNTNHITPPRQQGSSLSATNQSGSYSNSNEENQIVEPEIDIPLRQHPQKPQIGSQSDTLSTLSIKSAPQITQEDEEDDNVPLAHYQNMPRQAVSVS